MSTTTHAAQTENPNHAAWQSGALQAIFAVFLGIITAVVVGVGVTTFHPNPADGSRQQLEVLYQQQAQDQGKVADGSTTAEEQAQQAQIMGLEAVAREQEQGWAASTSLIVIIIATALLGGAVALARLPQAWVFSTGLLLGGIFTMLYGVGLSFMATQSVLRFALLVTALLITGGLGYLRFVRGREGLTSSSHHDGQVADVSLTTMEDRVDALERSMSALRGALGG